MAEAVKTRRLGADPHAVIPAADTQMTSPAALVCPVDRLRSTTDGTALSAMEGRQWAELGRRAWNHRGAK